MVKKVPCPVCKKDVELVRVIYGYPSKEGQEAAKRGEIILGGCLFDESNPLYGCRICETPLPEYGTHKDLQQALGNKDTREAFREKEKELLGKSFILTEDEINKMLQKEKVEV